jgi:hypothetical protein
LAVGTGPRDPETPNPIATTIANVSAVRRASLVIAVLPVRQIEAPPGIVEHLQCGFAPLGQFVVSGLRPGERLEVRSKATGFRPSRL